MKKYNLINNCLGWGVFVIASIVYLMTAEPTASWWDCGEYIATTAKLQVGHPPGAPTFQLIGRLFSLLAGGDVTKIAHFVNSMSALCSGFTILFLFWTITMLAKKLVPDKNNMTTSQMIAIFGSGIVGSLAYTFSDTFWFSAVEGEVYAMSSCFTAIVFWAILKWETQADDDRNLRWIILISFLIGVAIGVHLLNILTIPAITYIIYFKKYQKTTKKGFILAGLLSIVLVAVVMYFIIPEIVNFASYFEVFFVNSIGLPFNSGTIIYFIVLFGLIIWGLMWSRKKMKPVFNTAILCFLFIILGYSTFFTLIIRANANTPLNENEPKDAVALLTYLNREQYGYTPTVYGPYFTAQVRRDADGSRAYTMTTKYIKDTANKKYIAVKRTSNPKWEESSCTIFPRMYSPDESRKHPIYYKMWSGMGENSYDKPTFGQNLKYFFRYQVNHMYWRYFMWNFVGRQNDIQSYGLNYENAPADASNGTKDLIHGNWISGFKFLDAARLGPQKNLPTDLANNKGRNTLYFLPLILGLCGLIYHIKKNGKDAFVVFLLFFMTGLAIVLYLNQPPCQPRERDYAYAGSFYAFAMWIGLGVYALCDWLKKWKMNENTKAIVISGVCLVAVPILMASQEWDDHDRSERYATRDFAKDYLESCDKDAILITFGDNDTFPLWYAQEVEGVRTDVRVLNYTLSGMGWYVEGLYNKLYNSDKLPFTLNKSFYGLGQDLNFIQDGTDTMELTDALKHVIKSTPQTPPFDQITELKDYSYISVLPTNNFKITFDKAKMAAKGIYPKELVDGQKGEFTFSIPTQAMDQEGRIKYAQLYRQELMLLDILATNGFNRPIYVINPYLIKDVIPNIMDYVRQEGLVYRLVPYPAQRQYETQKSYNEFMHTFKWGNVNKKGVYLENAVTINNSKAMRQNYSQLAQDLIAKGEKQKAINILDKACQEFPNSKLPFDKADLMLAQAYCNAGALNKGKAVYKSIIDYYISYINYYNQFRGKKARSVEGDRTLSMVILAQTYSDISNYGFSDLKAKISSIPDINSLLGTMNFQNQFSSLINNINNAVQSLGKGGDKGQASNVLKQALTQLEQAGKDVDDDDVRSKIIEVVQYIYGNAQKYSLNDVIGQIQSSSTLSSLLKTNNQNNQNVSMQQQ
jgi:tetratricopeptide (TPR) repeat protein